MKKKKLTDPKRIDALLKRQRINYKRVEVYYFDEAFSFFSGMDNNYSETINKLMQQTRRKNGYIIDKNDNTIDFSSTLQ